ncbi:unnamed protein product, partial [Ectocarpus fasciculatus]
MENQGRFTQRPPRGSGTGSTANRHRLSVSPTGSQPTGGGMIVPPPAAPGDDVALRGPPVPLPGMGGVVAPPPEAPAPPPGAPPCGILVSGGILWPSDPPPAPSVMGGMGGRNQVLNAPSTSRASPIEAANPHTGNRSSVAGISAGCSG